MKKYISLFLILLISICVCFCGCNADKSTQGANKQDYIVNNNGSIINIGVIAPTTGINNEVGNDIVSGVKFANSLAEGVNIDTTYLVNLCVYDLNEDINEVSEKLINEKVAAVICAGTDYDKANSIIEAFDKYNTPVVFTDSFSDKITSSSSTYSISVPYSYQNSLVSAYLTSDGLLNGAVICSDDNYSTAFSKSFKTIFEGTGGSVNIKNEAKYESEDFIFIIGNDTYLKNTAEAIKAENPSVNIILSEVYNKNTFENDILQDVSFISKFEVDIENNHIGTDFINVYSDMNDVNESDISSAVAYGYDAYMLIYGALAKCNPNSTGIDNNSQSEENIAIDVSRINESLKNFIHYGVTDTIAFNDKGLLDTKFIYLDKVENSKAAMLNRYVY